MTEARRTKILVIDGDAEAGAMIAEALAARGPEVHEVADPGEGVEKAKALGPDLIFISLLFPDSNGLKLSKQIHSVEGLKEVPVVMLISYQGELDPRYTSAIGIVDVLVKPLTREDIVSKTLKILGEDAFPEVTAAAIAEETPVFEEKEAAEEEETVIPHAGAVEIEEFSAGHGGGDDLPVAADEDLREPVSEGGERLLRGASGKMTARNRIFAAAAILSIAVIGISAYRLKKVFYPSGRESAPVSSVGTIPGEKSVTAGGRTRGEEMEKTKSPSPAVPEEQKKVSVPSAAVPPQKEAHEASRKEYLYSVQVGAFSSEQNAAALVGKLKNKGYDAFTERDGVRPVYRVLVGRYADPNKASEKAGLLKKEGLKSIIIRIKG